nr:reverse transcriptase domain-containing protein [Tanacetum cinerariifolium]
FIHEYYLKGRTHRSSKQKVENSNSEEHLPPVATMADNRTMAEMLCAPTEGCAEAIVVPLILAEQFELKHSLINMMTSEEFFGLEKDNLHDHIRWFNKITSTIKYRDVPNSVIKLILFPFSLAGAARWWLEKEPTCFITTWDDLVSKFINEFFPPSRTTNLHNEILNFHQKFDESFHEAWERYKDLLRACPHHDFTELHQLDTFYNALNPADQDSLNAAAGGNLLEKSPQDALTIIENKSKQTSAVTTAMTAMIKQLQANPPPTPVKAVEEICVTCGGNYNQGNPGYRPQGAANQMRPPEQSYQATAQPNQNFHLNELEKIKRMNEVSIKAMQNQIDMVKNELRNEMKTSIQTSLSNQTNEIKNMMASLLQMNTPSTSGSGSLPSNIVSNPKGELKAITTRSGLVTDGPTVPTPPKSVTPEVAVILKKVPEKLRDPGKFLIPCGFSKLKCKALANLGASINLMPLSVWKELGLPEIISTHMTLELASSVICTPDGIAKMSSFQTDRALIDVHGKEMILRDGDERLTLNMKHDTASYSNNPPRESVNLINIFNVSSKDFLEVSVLNQTSGNPTFSLHQELTSSEVTHEIHDSEGCNFLSASSDIDSINDIHPHFDDDPLSGSTTYSANSLLEEFTDELALITYPPDYDNNLQFDIESDLKEIEFLLYQEVESDADNIYDDPFDSKGEKIKESKLLIDELDLSCDFLPYSEYDSFDSQDFSKVDALPLTNNKEKVFNPGILIQKEPVKIITRVVQEKKPARSSASLVLEDFDPPFYEPLVFKDVPKSKMLLPFSSKNEEKVFKPGIYTYRKVKERQEKDKIKTKPDKKGKREKARQCRRPITVKKAGKEKKIQV